MKRSLFAGLLSATILASTAVPSHSEALSSNPLPGDQSIVRVMALYHGAGARHDDKADKALLMAQADAMPEGRDMPPREGFRPPHIERAASGPALHLAGRLAAAETYIGIKSAQLDAWRSYAAAVVDLVDRPTPDQDHDGPRGERTDDAPPAGASRPQPIDAPLFAERLAEQAIERGAKANTLKAAAAALRTALDPEQIAKLRDAERSFLPPPQPHGPDNGFAGHGRGHGEFPPPLHLPPPFAE